MKLLLILLLSIYTTTGLVAQEQPLPYSGILEQQQTTDWLISPVNEKAGIYYSVNQQQIILFNGLVKRVFTLQPGLACIDYRNLSNNQQLLRAIRPEAEVTINKKTYSIGGLSGQKEQAYLVPGITNKLSVTDSSFRYTGFSIQAIQPQLNWKSRMWMPEQPKASGKSISFHFEGSATLKGIAVDVNYEIYDGIPLIVKSVTVRNNTGATLTINAIKHEILAVVEEENSVSSRNHNWVQHGLYVETNYAFNGSMSYDYSDQTTHWKKDSTYTSQVSYDLATPCLLEVYPNYGPDVLLASGQSLAFLRTHELLLDSYDRERRGLEIRKMYGIVAPRTRQNPIFLHLVSNNDQQVLDAIDQCVATGYESVIMSFGSHCNMEDTTADNINHWKKIAAIAHRKGIKIGGYSLFSSRKIGDEDDVINPVTGKPGGAIFGDAPCFGSKWGIAYRNTIMKFLQSTGFDIWENDGPYPGDLCASTVHPGHRGLDDSQWQQWLQQVNLYRWCSEQGIYINSPDWYFLEGANKTGIGYREDNFSLSRDQQKILNRQNIFDGTWEKTPSMGWGFVPLTRYHGGGEDAVLEPLSKHLNDYRQLMMQYYGAGVQACYRGPRLFDTDTTKAMVTEVIHWYKKYRELLNSDIIHVRRADGRDWDGWLHVNPSLKEKGMLMLFNPLHQDIDITVRVPLYYTGLRDTATVSIEDGVAKVIPIDRNYDLTLPVHIAAGGYVWVVIR